MNHKHLIGRAGAAFIVLAHVAIGPGFCAADDAIWDKAMSDGRQAYGEERYADAEDAFRRALTRAEDIDSKSEMRQKSAVELAKLLHKNGQFASAEDLLESAVDAWKKGVRHAGSRERHEMLSELCQGQRALGDCYRAEAKYKQAEHAYRDALNGEGIKDQGPVKIATIKSDLGDVLMAEGKYGPAEGFYKEAMPALEKGKETEELLDLLEEYASLLRTENRMAEAQKMEERVKALRNKAVEQQ